MRGGGRTLREGIYPFHFFFQQNSRRITFCMEAMPRKASVEIRLSTFCIELAFGGSKRAQGVIRRGHTRNLVLSLTGRGSQHRAGSLISHVGGWSFLVSFLQSFNTTVHAFSGFIHTGVGCPDGRHDTDISTCGIIRHSAHWFITGDFNRRKQPFFSNYLTP
ncbi:hypothetical protein VTG60DRAFT_6321 [Thermothelomyces hinnuleus]